MSQKTLVIIITIVVTGGKAGSTEGEDLGEALLLEDTGHVNRLSEKKEVCGSLESGENCQVESDEDCSLLQQCGRDTNCILQLVLVSQHRLLLA